MKAALWNRDKKKTATIIFYAFVVIKYTQVCLRLPNLFVSTCSSLDWKVMLLQGSRCGPIFDWTQLPSSRAPPQITFSKSFFFFKI